MWSAAAMLSAVVVQSWIGLKPFFSIFPSLISNFNSINCSTKWWSRTKINISKNEKTSINCSNKQLRPHIMLQSDVCLPCINWISNFYLITNFFFKWIIINNISMFTTTTINNPIMTIKRSNTAKAKKTEIEITKNESKEL